MSKPKTLIAEAVELLEELRAHFIYEFPCYDPSSNAEWQRRIGDFLEKAENEPDNAV